MVRADADAVAAALVRDAMRRDAMVAASGAARISEEEEEDIEDELDDFELDELVDITSASSTSDNSTASRPIAMQPSPLAMVVETLRERLPARVCEKIEGVITQISEQNLL